MEYNGRIKKCFYALLACIFNPELSVSKSQELFELKESDMETYDGDRAERARQKMKKYYYAHREQVLARNKAYRERNRGK